MILHYIILNNTLNQLINLLLILKYSSRSATSDILIKTKYIVLFGINQTIIMIQVLDIGFENHQL